MPVWRWRVPRLLGASIGKIMTTLGYNGTGFYPLTVDSDGQLQVDLVGDVLNRYDSAYRASANATGASGNIVASMAAVAAGKLVVVEGIAAYLAAGSAASLYISVRSGGVNYDISVTPTPTVLQALYVYAQISLVAGENLLATAAGVGAGTSLFLIGVGHYIR